MREVEHKFLLISLAGFISLLAVVQPVRPILAAERSDLPAAANRHQELTRHCIEEVGNEEFEEPSGQVSCAKVEDADRKGTQPEVPRPADLPAWPSQPIHRKLLPPSPQDG